MKLNDKEFKRFKDLKKLVDSNKASASEKEEFEILKQKKMSKDNEGKGNNTKRENVPFEPGNDFSWWNKFPELMRDAANLKSNYIPGTDLGVDSVSGDAIAVPGVMSIKLLDTYGRARSATDPINVFARDLYLKMFQKYRGISSYTACDLGIVCVAALEIFKQIGFMERIYGIINYYDKMNWNMPYTLIEALGLTPARADYIRGHLSDFRYDLNYLINKAQRVCLPKGMSLLANKLSLYTQVYKDHDSVDAQYIIFSPRKFGVFDETSLSTGSAIQFFDVNLSNNTHVSISGTMFFPFLNNAIDALAGSDSAQKIFGDMLAWFGEEQMDAIYPLPEEMIVKPVYSESILHKIHNMDIVTMRDSHDPKTIVLPQIGTLIKKTLSSADQTVLLNSYSTGVTWMYQDVASNTIQAEYSLGVGASAQYTYDSEYDVITGASAYMSFCLNGNRLLDAYHKEFSEETVCEGILWKTFGSHVVDPGGGTAFVLDGVAAEVVLECHIYTMYSNGQITDDDFYNFLDRNNDTVSTYVHAMMSSVFDWSPIIYMCYQYTQFDYPIVRVTGDIDCCRLITYNDVRRIQSAAMLSAIKTEVQPIK